MNKLTALIEAAKAANTQSDWYEYQKCYDMEIIKVEDQKLIALANPATILELCALLEKAEAAMNSPSGRKYVEALAAIKQWKEQDMTDTEFTAIYNEANGIVGGKNPPITTQRIFAAMRLVAEKERSRK